MSVAPDLLHRVLHAAHGRRHLLGLAGEPGSGKTTLAVALVEALCARRGAGFAVHVPMDGFHLADDELRRLGLLDRKGAVATFDGWGYLALLRRLAAPRAGEPVYAPRFERDLEQPLAGAIAVAPEARVIVTEGNYLLLDGDPWAGVRATLDEVWACVVDPQVRRARLVDRHRRFGKSDAAARQWVRDVDEVNARLVAPTLSRAALIVADGTARR